MSLVMSRPFKHPKTGVFYLRKRVPTDLVSVLGRREEKISLKTKDPAEAKRLYAQALAELEARWSNLRIGKKDLTELEALELAREIHDLWYNHFADMPGQQTTWHTNLHSDLWSHQSLADGEYWRIGENRGRMRTACRDYADYLVRQHGISAPDGVYSEFAKQHGFTEPAPVRQVLAHAVGIMIQRACLELEARGRGEHLFASGITTLNVSIPRSDLLPSSAPTKPFSFDDAVTLWISEKRPRERTIYEWRRTIRELGKFVGHDDAHRLTVEDVIAWKNALLEANLATKTIKDAKLAVVRAILQVAVDNRKLAQNPAEKVTISVKKVLAEARRDFTDAEAVIVLKASLTERSAVLRWVPWICAYTGARVSEACQLRREDVEEQDGIWALRFAAEAGSLKNTNSERALPVHPALIASGFVQFVRTVKTGPLFPELPPDKIGKRGGNGTKVLGRWVRGLGLTDERLAPNHSWRHRFKTMGRRYDLRLDIMDAMTGHAPKSVGNAYGTYPMDAMLRELKKIPILKVDA